MTVLEDRIAMAEEDDELTLDNLFASLEPATPEGYKVEIVEGTVFMVPQRDIHWAIIRRIVRALEDVFGVDVNVLSDVRIDFPGALNGYAPDVAKVREGATKNAKNLWSHQDLEFIAEVISQGTAANDYGPKRIAYATAEVPVYLIADPYQGRCHVFTDPKEGDYATETRVSFGSTVDLTGTVVGLTLETDGFPRD
ncbi:Uma2 family endonuclease [Streptomyces sp. NBC_00490]|uniref:Uma2 family endonuclease n=1 Tax=Streptomyces sp. NBC_00490 TaxID=2903657 RepID=UPI002E174689